jgi:hypothetical protein
MSLYLQNPRCPEKVTPNRVSGLSVILSAAKDLARTRVSL